MLRRVAQGTVVVALAAALGTALLLLAGIGLAVAEDLAMPDAGRPGIAAAVAQNAGANELRAIATALAIAAGIAVAWYKLDIFREFEPHLTITQTVESRPLGDSYALVTATATLSNNSKVQVKPRAGYCLLRQTAPLDDSEVVAIYQAALARSDTTELEQFDWPMLHEIRQSWPEGNRSIEPGEQHQETYQFIISRDTKSVVVLTVIYNPQYGEGNRNRAESWRCYTFHDVRPAQG